MKQRNLQSLLSIIVIFNIRVECRMARMGRMGRMARMGRSVSSPPI